MRFVFLITMLAPMTAFAAAHSQDMQLLIDSMQRVMQKGGMSQADVAKQQRNLQLGVVTMKIHGCIEDAVGKPRLDGFMDEMNSIGKTIEGYCNTGQSQRALDTALATAKAKQNDIVAIAARNCYQESKMEIEPLLNDKAAADAAQYERWAEDPDAAMHEAKPTDICK